MKEEIFWSPVLPWSEVMALACVGLYIRYRHGGIYKVVKKGKNTLDLYCPQDDKIYEKFGLNTNQACYFVQLPKCTEEGLL